MFKLKYVSLLVCEHGATQDKKTKWVTDPVQDIEEYFMSTNQHKILHFMDAQKKPPKLPFAGVLHYQFNVTVLFVTSRFGGDIHEVFRKIGIYVGDSRYCKYDISSSLMFRVAQ